MRESLTLFPVLFVLIILQVRGTPSHNPIKTMKDGEEAIASNERSKFHRILIPTQGPMTTLDRELGPINTNEARKMDTKPSKSRIKETLAEELSLVMTLLPVTK